MIETPRGSSIVCMIYVVEFVKKVGNRCHMKTELEHGPFFSENMLLKPEDRSFALALRAITPLFQELVRYGEYLREQAVKEQKTVRKKK